MLPKPVSIRSLLMNRQHFSEAPASGEKFKKSELEGLLQGPGGCASRTQVGARRELLHRESPSFELDRVVESRHGKNECMSTSCKR